MTDFGWIGFAKGQLISKAIYGVLDSPKKQTKQSMVVPTFLTMKIFSVYRHQKEDNFTRDVQLASPIKKATLDL